MAHRLISTLQRYFCIKKVTNCMILHPVSYPNKGPIVEQYLAEEAIGLAKSLGWVIVRGPLWNSNKTTPSFESKPGQIYIDGVEDEIKDGDYIRTSIGNGILYKDGIIFDESQSQGDLYKQWQDKLIRQSLANSSLIKTRKITKKTFFTKGKLNFIADSLKITSSDCLFINAELKPVQVKNLKKFIEARMNNLTSPLAKSLGESESETQFETEDNSQKLKKQTEGFRKIRIFDRFSIILQIFAQRSNTKLSQLQVELSFLNYLKTRLVREGATYSSNLNIFYGDLMKVREVPMEVISAKQRRTIRTLGGEGQSQLQIQRRQIRDKEARLRKEIEQESRLRKIQQEKTKRRSISLPVVALVGYTNVGKSAFMNYMMKKEEVKSKDLLFQTLNTTSRQVTLPSGTKVMLLDTIGFITNLPVEMVEAFKSTLQEISHADLVLHLRDASHPQHELQKISVLKILKQLKFEQSFYNEKMLQIWNKIDLVPYESLPQGTPNISCLTGVGMQNLARLLENKLNSLKGRAIHQVQYGLEKHSEVLDWLRTNTAHTFNVKTEYDYNPSVRYPNGSVKIKLELQQALINKLQRYLNPEKKRNKSEKGMPPKGW